MKKIVLKSILLIAILVILDLSFGYFVVNRAVKNQETPLNYGFTQANDDIMIVGSSRALRSYIPLQIEDSTGYTAYNLGEDYMCIYYYNIMIKAILNYHTPKMIIIDIIEKDFEKHGEGRPIDMNKKLKNYYTVNKEVTEAYNRLLPIEDRVPLLSAFYRSNSSLTTLLQQTEIDRLRMENKGYRTSGSQIYDLALSHNIFDYRTDEIQCKYDLFAEIFELCKEKNIKVACIISPMYLKNDKVDELFEPLTSFIKEHDVPVYNYSNDPRLLTTHKNFIDILHLSHEGAVIFTDIVSKEVIAPTLNP